MTLPRIHLIQAEMVRLMAKPQSETLIEHLIGNLREGSPSQFPPSMSGNSLPRPLERAQVRP